MEITKNNVDRCFEFKSQGEVVVALYRLAFPDWDDIVSIKGWPKVSIDTNQYIFERFIEFDRIHHPEALGGGLWMNKGWGTTKMDDWVIDTTYCGIEHKEGCKKNV